MIIINDGLICFKEKQYEKKNAIQRTALTKGTKKNLAAHLAHLRDFMMEQDYNFKVEIPTQLFG